jgi:hypothetical protein
MSDMEKDPAESETPSEPAMNRAQRRALAAGKSAPGNAALGKGNNTNGGLNRAAVPPAQRIQTRGAGRGK